MSLRAPDLDEIQAALGPVLALCAPLGMTAQDRVEWITAAADTVRNVPADLLAAACRKARAVCDHPSKIIPFIMQDIAAPKAERQRDLQDVRVRMEPPKDKPISRAEREEVAAMMRDWRVNGYSAAYARKRRWI